MTESENSLRIINGLPSIITYKGNYYGIEIGKSESGWDIWYERLIRFSDEIAFEVKAKTIEQTALEMHEILIENNLYK